MKKGKFTGKIVGIAIVFAMLGMIIASSLALSVETEATPAILVENHSPVEPSENYGIGLMGKIAFVHDVYPGNSEIYVMNADGTNQIQLTDSPQNDYHPAWSPDGTKIAFCSPRDGDWEIYAMNADGSGQTRLTNNPAVDANPSWSPDGTKIAFNSHRDGDWEIYVMTPDGSSQTRLTNNAADDVYPSWSPDGTKIAFLSDRDGNREIYVMNAGGGGEERVTYNSACDEEPAWSPDGNRIAFASDRDGNYEIYAMNADGSGQTRLTTNPAWDYGPTWSPDSTKIAFTSLRDSNREIYAMNADGSGQTRLTENAVSDFSPAWSPVSNGIPPTVSNTSPEDGATAVTVDTTVTATFSEAMDASTINTESFNLAGGAVSGTVTYDPATYTATFTPDANLEYDHTYTASLSTAITDLAGNPLAEPYAWSFTTAGGYVFNPPFSFGTTTRSSVRIPRNGRNAAANGFSNWKDDVANPSTGNIGYTVFTWGGYLKSFNVFVPGGKKPNQAVESEAVLGVDFAPSFTGTVAICASFTLDGQGVGCAGAGALDYVSMFLPFSIPFMGPSKTLFPTMATAKNQVFLRVNDSVAYENIGDLAVASEYFFPSKMEVDYTGKNVIVTCSISVEESVPITIEAGLVSELKSWGNAAMVVNLENSHLNYISVIQE